MEYCLGSSVVDIPPSVQHQCSLSNKGLFIDPGITTGSLYYYDYTSPSGLPHPMPPQKFPHDLGADFHPLGMEFDSKTSRLYVVNHAAAGSRIDVLTLSATSSTPSLTYLSTIKHPLLRTPNSITQLSDHELYITNDHYFKIRDNKLLALAETYLAIPGGSVAYVNTETNEVRKVASLPFANGITVLNDTTLAVASTTRPGLYIYSIDPISRALTKKQTIKLTFSVDNLSIDKNGKVLMAGHPHFPSLAAVAKTNHRYDFAVQEIDDVRPRAPSWVADWDGNEVKDLHVGSEYGTACTAVRDTKAGVVIVTGLYERGILVARETK